MSIKNGNYMNIGKNDTSNMVPTYQKMQDQKNFFENHFGGSGDKKRPLDNNIDTQNQGHGS